MTLFMGVVIFMTVTMALPRFGPVLVRFAGLAFLLSFLAFIISFIATPYRLGSVFLHLEGD